MKFFPPLDLDAELGGGAKPCILFPESLQLHSRGARLWATRVRPALGLWGCIHWVHKTNIPELFRIRLKVAGELVDERLQEYRWHPNFLELTYAAGPLIIKETKFITWGDTAISLLSITNGSESPVAVGVSPTSPFVAASASLPAHGRNVLWGLDVRFELYRIDATTHATDHVQELGPGEGCSMGFAVACTLADDPRGEERRPVPTGTVFRRHKDEQREWEAGIPIFLSDRPHLNRMWNYRWLLTKVNLSHPGVGALKYPLFYEGRGHKGSAEPWEHNDGGFARLIPFSTPCHMLDGRWHRDPRAVFGEVRNAVANPGEGGRLTTVSVHGPGSRKFYNHAIAWTTWQAYLVHRDISWLADVADGLAKDLDAWLAEGPLPIIYDHNKTGMEYQPSYWYFTGYPEPPEGEEENGKPARPRGLDRFSPMRRVDTAVYVHLNAVGLAEIYRALGEAERSERYSRVAEEIGGAILTRMWDPERRFFYDIHFETGEKAPVENIAGFFPFLTGLCRDEHGAAWSYLQDPAAFGTRFPFPSVSVSNPMYAPDATVAGVWIKGPRGCVWNGPSWPMANGFVIDGLATYSKRSGHGLDALAFDALERTTELYFHASSVEAPTVVEHYNPETGEAISGEEDYFHSIFVDLVVRHLAGVTPGPEPLPRLDPLQGPCDWFCLQDLPYNGHLLTVTWLRPGVDVNLPWETGYRIFVDGTLRAWREDLGPLSIPE